MKRKILILLSSIIIGSTFIVGCGGKNDKNQNLNTTAYHNSIH